MLDDVAEESDDRSCYVVYNKHGCYQNAYKIDTSTQKNSLKPYVITEKNTCNSFAHTKYLLETANGKGIIINVM